MSALPRAVSEGVDPDVADLLPELRVVARELGASFRDVTTAEDVLGDLALAAHEHWIAEWSARSRRGEARGPLLVFLRDRMRDRLREERRRRARRSELLAEAGLLPGGTEPGSPAVEALGTQRFPAPDALLAAAELRERAAQASPDARTIVELREAGLDQREIAQRTSTSRATISRRLAAIAALLAAMVVTLVALGWWVGSSENEARRAARPSATLTPVLPRPAAVPATPIPAPAPPVAEAPRVVPAPEEPQPPLRARDRLGARPPPQAQHGTGRLLVNSLPFARVYLDGRDLGMTPLIRDVAAGRHVLRLVTQDGREARRSIEVRAGESFRLVHRF